MIIDYKLTYPSGTATAVLINGFHTPQGDEMAKYGIIIKLHFMNLYHCNILKFKTQSVKRFYLF